MGPLPSPSASQAEIPKQTRNTKTSKGLFEMEHFKLKYFRTSCPTEKLISVQLSSRVQTKTDFKHLNKVEQKNLVLSEVGIIFNIKYK